MMTVNIDIEDGLVNGACGKLIMIDYGKLQKTNETVSCRLWIKFNEEKTGRKTRANFQNVMRNRNIDLSLTPIEPVTRQINTRSTNFKVERKQFPVVPCEAMTIYKSQCDTYEKVVVNLKKGMTRSELYVASSRATKASGLYLVGDFVPPKPPESNDAAAMMFKNMRSERMLKFSLEFPEESQERFYLMFHNEKNHIEYSSIKIDDFCIISIYNSPNSSFDVVKRHINEVITVSKRFCENIVIVGDFNPDLKIKTNHKFIDYMESFGLTLINELNKNSTNAKTQIDYCFTNGNGLKSDYFESLTSFHKPIWIRKREILTEIHVDEIKQIRRDIPFNLKDLRIYDQSDMMEVDEEFSSDRYKIVDENEQTDIDTTFNLKILDHFLLVLDFNITTDTDQISNQVQIINDLIGKSPFISMHNKDQSVQLKSKTEYSVQAFDSVYARTRTTADGNCLYSSLSIINIGSEKLTHSMILLAVNAMINNSDYFQTLCKGGEVQIQAFSIALSHPIYSYIQFDNNPKNRHYIPLNISVQELIDRFNKETAGGHLKYIGYKADMNKLGFCIYYNGTHYDALLPFQDNPQQFVPHFDLINMSL
ncbi:unnamed protein product [Rotaria sp. Silwood1]|nr:unnamed protein product [Rotaria sp. Silwood1]CAF1611501.1 unnamed protein product [Rotaria sp. Silwood1]